MYDFSNLSLHPMLMETRVLLGIGEFGYISCTIMLEMAVLSFFTSLWGKKEVTYLVGIIECSRSFILLSS